MVLGSGCTQARRVPQPKKTRWNTHTHTQRERERERERERVVRPDNKKRINRKMAR